MIITRYDASDKLENIVEAVNSLGFDSPEGITSEEYPKLFIITTYIEELTKCPTQQK